MPLRLDSKDSDFAARFAAFADTRRAVASDVDQVVAEIIADVRARGDAALIDYTKRFDRLDLSARTLRIDASEIEAAGAAADPDAVAALRFAAGRIEEYHRHQVPQDYSYSDAEGITLGARWTAIAAAGLYVPGGTAAYPSSVLMNAIPARLAGVERMVMAVPTPDGQPNPLVLAAAQIAGVSEIYRIGGAQAIAALAYGTESIARVDLIVGPGNDYVAAAKRRVFGTVGIDSIAGPSEILVVADAQNNPAWIAADLLSQAEHDTSSQVVLITDDPDFADAVTAESGDQLSSLPRAKIAAASWLENGAVVTVESLDQAVPLIDRLAPEHLELAIEDPDKLADAVRNAGAIFLGRFAPEAIGDYVAGPNHVLPTERSARFSSGLGVLDFMKRTSMVRCDEAGLAAIGPAAVTLARAEGLDAHAKSISLRLASGPGRRQRSEK
ncbi:MAG: histidinol dehydrogenase [Alphaproteobacteria bacterium]|nr:histidinol dehydrogenase [Alphaproteobacteria bacterium]